MPGEIYKTRMAIVIPFSLAVITLFTLWVISLLTSPLPYERLVIGALFFVAFFFFLETFFRNFVISSEGLVIRKFFRSKKLKWEEITHLGLLVLDRKAFALLTTTKGFHILSNNLSNFSEILRRIKEGLGDEKVDAQVASFIEHPLINNRPVRSAWLVVVITVAIIALRVYSL